MGQRTVVSIEPGFDNNVIIRLSKAPKVIQNARKPGIFQCDPDQLPAWTQPQAVQGYGQKIFAALRQHQAVQEALNDILGAPRQQPHPLYFSLEEGDAERLCWETLCNDKGRFLALDARWPIARMPYQATDQSAALPHDFVQPLRIMALLSALGVDAKTEWRELRNAIRAGREKGVTVELRLFVGQEKLLNAIQKEIDDGLSNVQVSALPGASPELEDQIATFKPQILHFFCHGVTGFGVAQLELATILDWDQGNQRGSLQLDIDDLANIPALKQVWLVTLNCCKSGQSDTEQFSMAHTLVNAGIPAVVGMLEPIDAADAHTFCGRFYRALFDKFHAIQSQLEAQPGENFAELEWPEALHSARKALAEKSSRNPIQHREWSLPVLYVRPETFQLRRSVAALDAKQLQKIMEVARALQDLREDTPAETRKRILAILDDIPLALRPDLFGKFASGGA
jgi:hypothetical protein